MTLTHEDLREEYRQQLLTHEQESIESFDKAVLSLSGGALGLSITFLNNLIFSNTLVRTELLLFAWICWGSSLILTLTSFWLSARAMNKAVQQLDEGKLGREHPGGMWDKATRKLTFLGGFAFILGVVFIIVFVYFNL